MTTLPPVTLPTPSPQTTIQPVVKRRWWGRAFDVVGFVVTFFLAFLASVGEIDFASLGLTPTQAAWAGMGLFFIRFMLAYRPIQRVDLKVEPGEVQ